MNNADRKRRLQEISDRLDALRVQFDTTPDADHSALRDEARRLTALMLELMNRRVPDVPRRGRPPPGGEEGSGPTGLS